MPATSMSEVLARSELEQAGEESDRYVEMSFAIALPDQPAILRAGGRWDRRESRYVARAEAGMPGTAAIIHPGQVDATLWFKQLLIAQAIKRDLGGHSALVGPEAFAAMTDEQRIAHDARLVGRSLEADEIANLEAEVLARYPDPLHTYAALFAGGRRGGKSWIGVAFGIAFAVDLPKSIVWLTSPTDTTDDELVRYVRERLPREWIDSETGEGWELCNGTQLLLLSAYNPENLKRGEAHFVLLNEGQRMKRRAYTLARGATIDSGGIVIVCANPPVEAGDQQWPVDLAVAADATRSTKKRQAIHLHFDPRKNPHIDHEALYALAGELDERTAAIEVWGEFRAAIDAVAYNWNRLESERLTPLDLPDVTEIFLSLLEEGDGIRQVVGLDVQRIPYIGGPVYRFFGDPTREEVKSWIVDEVVLDGGDEVDFCDELRARDFDPSETLIICDATGEYQHSRRRSTDAPPPEWQGRGSWSIIKQEGYTRIVAPDRNLRRKNPPIQDRIRAFTSRIKSADGVRRLFADPEKAPRCCQAIREWKFKNGQASRTQYEAHLGDGISYVVNRLFPRRGAAYGE